VEKKIVKRWLKFGLGLALVVLLVWLAFFWKRPKTVSEQKNVPVAGDRVSPLDSIQSIELSNQKSKVKFAKNEDGGWIIVEPQMAMVDPTFGGAFLDVLSELQIVRTLEKIEPEKLAEYGLNPSFAVLKFEFLDHKVRALHIGNPNPTRSGLYAYYEDEPYLFLVHPRIRMFLDKAPDFFRYRRLMGIQYEQISEVKIVVDDAKLREMLGVPNKRYLIRQKTQEGPVWLMLEPIQETLDVRPVSQFLGWFRPQSAIAEKVMDINEEDLAKWELEPPRAYFEFKFPDRTEIIKVGKEKDGYIYLLQIQRNEILGYDRNTILKLLSKDFRSPYLMQGEERFGFDRVEVNFPASQNKGYTVVKLDDEFWAIDGHLDKKFPRKRIAWLAQGFVSQQIMGYIDQRPVEFKKYNLQVPRLKIRYYSGGKLEREFWVGEMVQAEKRYYVYDAVNDNLVWYKNNVAKFIPPEEKYFLMEDKEKAE